MLLELLLLVAEEEGTPEPGLVPGGSRRPAPPPPMAVEDELELIALALLAETV